MSNKKTWIQRLIDSIQSASVVENPSVMTAAGWRVDRNGKVVQDKQNDKGVSQLRNNLTIIGEASVAAPTLGGDIKAAYQVVRHPVQSAKAVKKAVGEGVNYAKKKLIKKKFSANLNSAESPDFTSPLKSLNVGDLYKLIVLQTENFIILHEIE